MADTTNSQWNNNWDLQINTNDLDNQNTIRSNNEWESIIWKANEHISNNDYQDVDLRHIETNIKKRTWNKTQWTAIFFLIIILAWAIWFVFYKYDQYAVDYSNWIENNTNSIVDFYEKTKEKIYKIIWKEYEEKGLTIELSWPLWKTNLSNLIDKNKWYIYTKETIKWSLKNLFNTIIENTQALENAKQQLSTNWFFSSELSEIITSNESISSIQDSLNAIEAIKINSAISVFQNLDTFIGSLSKETWIDKDTIFEYLKVIKKRGEKDINLYIKNCRLNTYEINYNCNSIWDFDKYYELTDDHDFNTSFFKKLIEFIDEKLEQTEIPSFSINFRSYNKQNNELTFDIEINTFKEDEIELAKKWILSSHSFILNSLINNLKLSRAIISEGIEVKSIDINTRIIPIWDTEFTVNTSNKTFTVSIKNENQIEIDDFMY